MNSYSSRESNTFSLIENLGGGVKSVFFIPIHVYIKESQIKRSQMIV